MFYPASDKLLSELPTRSDDIVALDAILHDNGGEVILLANLAFMLDRDVQATRRLLERYETAGVARKFVRGECSDCKEVAELTKNSDCDTPVWSCDHCGNIIPVPTTIIECYAIQKSSVAKKDRQGPKEEAMAVEERFLHGRIRPWSMLNEEDYLRSLTTLGAADQQWVIERLEMYGFCLLRWQGMSPSHMQLQAIEEFLGPACSSQNNVEGKIKEINPKEALAANTGDSAKELSFHTDGTQDAPLPPAILVFQYLTTPTIGGMSTFLDMASVLSDMTAEDKSEMLISLGLSNAAVCEKKGLRYEGPLVRPVCADQSVSLRLRLDDKIAICPKAKSAFESMSKLVLEQTRYLKYMPHEGDIAIFDNWRVLHGRKSIEGGRHLRFHNRVWIKDLDDRNKGRVLLGIRGLEPELIAKIKQSNSSI